MCVRSDDHFNRRLQETDRKDTPKCLEMDRKLLYFSLFFLLVAMVVADDDDEWEKHKAKYNKKFKNDERRLKFYKKTQAMIEAHKKSEYGQDYKLAHNDFSTMSDEEKQKRLGHRRRYHHPKSSKKSSNHSKKTASVRMVSSDSLSLAELRQIQNPVDWRNDPCMTTPQDQGQCGSCWAFVATGVLEFNSCSKSGKKVELSQQQLIDCMDFDGCNGGNSAHAWEHVGAIGQVTSASYPYLEEGGTQCKFNADNVAATVSISNPVTYIATNDTKAMMATVAKRQAIAVSVSSLPKEFHSYKEGVFTGPCPTPTDESGHAMIIVGYGSTIKNGTNYDYWILRNSWGRYWGMGGYAFFQRGVNLCDIESRGIMTAVASTGDVLPLGTPHNFNWQSAANGQVMIATCSYRGYDGAVLPYAVASGEDCGGICAATSKCTHFFWRGNRCVLKAPGATTKAALSSADDTTRTGAGQCGYVVRRKSVGSWKTEGQFTVASNCAFTTTGFFYTLSLSNIDKCKSSCLEDPSRCNYFKFNGTCTAMKADSSMNPIPIFSNVSTCGYLSRSVTISQTGPALKAAPPVKTATVIDDSKYKVTSNCAFKVSAGARSVMSTDRLEKCKSVCQSQSCLYFTFSATDCTLWQLAANGQISTISATDSVCGQSTTVPQVSAANVNPVSVKPTVKPNPPINPVTPAVNPNPPVNPVKPTVNPNPPVNPVTPTVKPNPPVNPVTPAVNPTVTVTQGSAATTETASSIDDSKYQVTSNCAFKMTTTGSGWSAKSASSLAKCKSICQTESCLYFSFSAPDCTIIWELDVNGGMSVISATDSVCGQDATLTQGSAETTETASSIDDSKYQVTSNCSFLMLDGGSASLASDKQMDLATCKSYCTSDSCLYFTFSAPDCAMLTPTNGKMALIPATDSVCGQIATSEQSSDVINLMSSGDQVQSTPGCSFKPPTSGVTIGTLSSGEMTAVMCQYYCLAKSCNYFTFTSSNKSCQMLTTSRKLVQNSTKGSTCGKIIPASTSG